MPSLTFMANRSANSGKAVLLVSLVALLFVLVFYGPYDMSITGQVSRDIGSGSSAGFFLLVAVVVIVVFFVHRHMKKESPV